VPLSFTKLDLRDILWNMYHVRAFNIRAFVSQRPIQFIDNRPWRGGPKRRTFRRQSAKFMTIEMDEPFYWPKVPEDYSE
jgi:large subunit ribosomal protein L23